MDSMKIVSRVENFSKLNESSSLHPQEHGGVPRRHVLDGVHEVAGGAPVV